MQDTESEIRARENGTANNSPDLPGDGGDGEQGGSGLPVPSLSRTHLLIIGGVVAVAVIVWYVKSQDESGGSGSLDAAREAVDGSTEATIEDDGEEDEIRVAEDPNNPLAADASVVKEFRERGIISDGETEA